jgi:hypothetical protein
MYDSITKRSYVFKTASALYLGFARKRVKGSFSIRKPLCEQHVTRERQVQRACITTQCNIITFMRRKQLHTPTLKTKKLGGKILYYLRSLIYTAC